MQNQKIATSFVHSPHMYMVPKKPQIWEYLILVKSWTVALFLNKSWQIHLLHWGMSSTSIIWAQNLAVFIFDSIPAAVIFSSQVLSNQHLEISTSCWHSCTSNMKQLQQLTIEQKATHIYTLHQKKNLHIQVTIQKPPPTTCLLFKCTYINQVFLLI